MSELITSISGVRGIVGTSLNPEVIIRFAQAFAQFCGAGPVVVGFDGRPAGMAIRRLVCGALSMSGIDVIDLGMVPTPSVQLAVERSAATGGIAITASHNPSEWNGLKFIDETGVFLDAAKNAVFLDIVRGLVPQTAAWNGVGSIESRDGFIDEHIAAALDIEGLALDAIRSRRMKVVVDAVNASGSVVIPRLLERLGCTVVPLFCDASGLFPHTPEPLPENLSQLGDAVRDHGAQLGVAIDPDADRLVLFDENGRPFGEEYTITTAIDSMLSMKQGTDMSAVVNLSTTRAVDDVAAKYGARVYRAPVGEINVVSRMRENACLIGGEGSGGVIVPEVHEGRDSLAGLVLVLHALAGHNGPASSYRATLPDYVIRKFKYPVVGLDPAHVLRRAEDKYSSFPVNTEDGVRIDFPDGWVHLRKSNTEPIVRLIAEAHSFEEAGRLAEQVSAAVFD
jgi:phosphomannomutase